MKFTIYRVTGKRKEEYFKRKRQTNEKYQKLKKFLREAFPELKEEDFKNRKVAYYTRTTTLFVEESLKDAITELLKRKDLVSKGSNEWDGKTWIVFSPNRRTKAGKELFRKWDSIVSQPEYDSIPELLQVDAISLRDFFSRKTRFADVVEDGREVFLIHWLGFNPEELEGFEPLEVLIPNPDVEDSEETRI